MLRPDSPGLITRAQNGGHRYDMRQAMRGVAPVEQPC